ncbi:MAG: hypothetical protein GY731_11075, partial [Gammaproteobacteria bacterium]|nr:hypothetical protein [Gammaproteobacteria bacterium]
SDGTRYLSISADDPGSGEKAIVPDMTYPIPSGVAMLDTNGDDTTNRLYVGDTGGQLWRVDIEPDVSATAGIHTVVGKLATVSGANNAADERKIFYEPDIVQIRDYDYTTSGNERYDLVVIVTGNRANPLNTSVQDRAFAFRDQPDPMVDGAAATPSDHSDDNGLADNYTTIQGPLTGPPAAATTLWDATDINDPTGADLTALQGSDGWYLDFESSGEKGLAPPLIFAGVMFFTTYLPEGVATGAVCALAEGAGNFYGVNVLNAAAVYNWDNIGGNPGKGDRTIQLKRAGIPTGVLAVMLKEKPSLLVNYEEFDPNVEMPKERTYWFQDD